MGKTSNDEPSSTDEALMEAFRGGDAAAFALLVQRHQKPLFNYLMRSVASRARAEEMLQDVFLRVIRAKERYVVTAKFSTWLYTIARNMLVDEARRGRFRRHRSLDAVASPSDSMDGMTLGSTLATDDVPVDEAAAAEGLRQRILAAIDELPDEQREVFCMRHFAGLSFREIGDAVGVPENTAKSRMRYALERLRLELDDLAPQSTATTSAQERIHG